MRGCTSRVEYSIERNKFCSDLYSLRVPLYIKDCVYLGIQDPHISDTADKTE